MRVILVHLSDIHVRVSNARNSLLLMADQISKAINSTAVNVGHIFIAVSGDIAYSGNTAEYQLADIFFTEIKEKLGLFLPESDVHFIFVPGNHDCDFSSIEMSRELLLERISPEKCDESVISQCVKVQAKYESFATRWMEPVPESSYSGKVYRKIEFNFDGNVIEFHLLNTAWMSIKEEQSRLVFPIQLLTNIQTEGTGADVVVSMLHHPYSWFENNNARTLRHSIESYSDLILTGHEHDGDHYKKSKDSGETNEYLEGEVLQDYESPSKSGFNLLVIDIDGKTQEFFHFVINKSGYYEPDQPAINKPLLRNINRLRNEFLLKESFEEYLLDPGVPYTHPYKEKVNLDDIFLYPDFWKLPLSNEEDDKGEMIQNPFPQLILKDHHLMIVGPEKSGKTSLAKTIFRDFRSLGYIPILQDGSDFNDSSEKAVISTIEKIYNQEYKSPDHNRFRQLERDKRVIIIDNFVRAKVNSKGRDNIIKILQSLFEYIIIFVTDDIRISDLIATGGDNALLWNFSEYQIMEFGYLKRSELIEKWYLLGQTYIIDETELSRRVVEAERIVNSLLGRNLIPSYPIFVLMLLQQLELQQPIKNTSTTGSYGFLYESLLTNALARISGLAISLDIQYTYLSEFAYFLFSKRIKTAKRDDAFDWHQQHNVEYSLRLEFDAMIKNFCNASILKEENGNITFRYAYLYYYFVGRYFSEHIQDKNIREYISKMADKVYQTESANILLFLCYLSKDPFVKQTILKSSRALFSSYEQCDLVVDSGFLNKLSTKTPELILDSSDPNGHRRQILERKDKHENRRNSEKPTDSPPDDADDAVDKELQVTFRINAALKSIQILGQILRNFHGSVKGKQKLELAEEAYSLGLRVLKFLFEVMEHNKDQFIAFFTELFSESQPDWSQERIDEEAKDAIIQIMEALSIVIIKYISDSIGNKNLSVTFDELMVGERRISYKFIDVSVRLDYFYNNFPEVEVFSLYKDVRKNAFTTNVLRRIVWHHFYIYPSNHALCEKVCKKLDIQLVLPKILDQRAKLLKS